MQICNSNILFSILRNCKNINYLSYFLLFLNSILLSIWAIKHTIALRNFLLVFGFVISIIIIKRELIFFNNNSRFSLSYVVPLIFILLMFLWVLSHSIFISNYPELQFKELKSTWLRAILAVINGLAIGLVVRRNLIGINLLWFGILTSFLVLFCQYIPRVIETFRMYQYDPYGYIFHVKINAVLVGTILIAGLGGLTFDLLKYTSYSKKRLQIFFCAISLFLVLYAYVFIFDTRNGIGISAILLFFWSILLFKKIITNKRSDIQKPNILTLIIGLCFIILIFTFFAIQQSAYNSGWSNYFEDFLIGLQSDKYVNWRDFNNLGMPVTPSGREISASTYERTALFVEGLKIIMENPWGCGVLTQPFIKMLPSVYPEVTFGALLATHSAWVEFGLAFGFPGLFFLIGALLLSAINTIKDLEKSVAPMMTLSLILGILIIYLVGELSTQHGVEILFYFLGLISVIQFPNFLKNTLEKYK